MEQWKHVKAARISGRKEAAAFRWDTTRSLRVGGKSHQGERINTGNVAGVVKGADKNQMSRRDDGIAATTDTGRYGKRFTEVLTLTTP